MRRPGFWWPDSITGTGRDGKGFSLAHVVTPGVGPGPRRAPTGRVDAAEAVGSAVGSA